MTRTNIQPPEKVNAIAKEGEEIMAQKQQEELELQISIREEEARPANLLTEQQKVAAERDELARTRMSLNRIAGLLKNYKQEKLSDKPKQTI